MSPQADPFEAAKAGNGTQAQQQPHPVYPVPKPLFDATLATLNQLPRAQVNDLCKALETLLPIGG